MKKTVFPFIVIIFILASSFVSYADTLHSVGETDSHTVFGTARFSFDDNVYTARSSDGGYTVTTDSGNVITVIGTPESLTLVVREIRKTDESYEWFSSSFKNYGGEIIPYDIYFVDSDFNRVNVGNTCRVEIKISKNASDAFVLTPSGDIRKTDADISNVSVKLNFNFDGYCVLLVSDAVSKPEKPIIGGKIPLTGDSRAVFTIAGAFAFSMSFTLSALLLKRRKNKE